jgi:hypothetical protein
VPYFIAVIAIIVYTNKLIKTGKITASATGSDSEYPDNDYDNHNIIGLIDNSSSDNDNSSKNTGINKQLVQTIAAATLADSLYIDFFNGLLIINLSNYLNRTLLDLSQ